MQQKEDFTTPNRGIDIVRSSGTNGDVHTVLLKEWLDNLRNTLNSPSYRKTCLYS